VAHGVESFISIRLSRMSNSLRYSMSCDPRTSYHQTTMRSVFVLIERRGEA